MQAWAAITLLLLYIACGVVGYVAGWRDGYAKGQRDGATPGIYAVWPH